MNKKDEYAFDVDIPVKINTIPLTPTYQIVCHIDSSGNVMCRIKFNSSKGCPIIIDKGEIT
jgi:hypothetical protein